MNEKLRNSVIEMQHTGSIVKMETDIMGDRLKILTDSINSIGNSKEVEDWMNILIEAKDR